MTGVSLGVAVVAAVSWIFAPQEPARIPWPIDVPAEQIQLGATHGQFELMDTTNCHSRPCAVGRCHRGVDVLVPAGTRVFAVADGQVVNVTRDTRTGHALIIRHALADRTIELEYRHLRPDSVQFKNGDSVARDDLLGEVIAWPCVGYDHLHLDITSVFVGWSLMTQNQSVEDPLRVFESLGDTAKPVVGEVELWQRVAGGHPTSFGWLPLGDQVVCGAEVDIIAEVCDTLDHKRARPILPARLRLEIRGGDGYAVDRQLELAQMDLAEPANIAMDLFDQQRCPRDLRTGPFYVVFTAIGLQSSQSDCDVGDTTRRVPWNTAGLKPGAYTIRLCATDAQGNISAWRERTVDVVDARRS